MTGKSDTARLTQRQVCTIFGVQAVAFCLLGAGLYYWTDRPIASFVVFDPSMTAWGLMMAGAMIVFAFGCFRVWPEFADRLMRLQRTNFAFLKPPFAWGPIVFLAICAGVGEEVLFRGGVQTFLSDLMGPFPAILATSAMFAALHISKPILTLLIFVIGIVFGIVYWMTGSLLLVMVAHSVYDIFAIRYLQRRLNEIGWSDGPPNT
ncbi:MAG: CPBP family intramembrane glutamic endopeptidase [Pontixanthobacter sp.]